MEKYPQFQHQITLDDELKRIEVYIKMRNIRMPILARKTSNSIILEIIFINTNMEFKVTNIKTAYTESIKFIEEMYDEFNTTPLRQYSK